MPTQGKLAAGVSGPGGEREGEPTKGQPGSALYLRDLLQFSQQPRVEAVPSPFTDEEAESPRDKVAESPRDKVACPKLLMVWGPFALLLHTSAG